MCHVSRLVLGVMVSVCIVGFIDDVDDVGMGLTWHCGGHDRGVGWWWLMMSGGRRGMVAAFPKESKIRKEVKRRRRRLKR